MLYDCCYSTPGCSQSNKENEFPNRPVPVPALEFDIYQDIFGGCPVPSSVGTFIFQPQAESGAYSRAILLHPACSAVLSNLQRQTRRASPKSMRVSMFDDTSYFVTVGLSNTVQLRLLGKYLVMLELLESLLCCLTRHSFFFLVLLLLSCSLSSFLLLSFSECNKDVLTLFNLRVSSLTEPGLYQDASDFWKL